jgi:hypothetical protein
VDSRYIIIILLTFTAIFLAQCEKKDAPPIKTATTKMTNEVGRSLSFGSDITLKDGELYEINGGIIGKQLTFTGGKIDGSLQSPNKRYVAYSLIVGYTDDVGEYEKNEKIPQVPVHHIIVMDLGLKLQLAEIKPQDIEPFIEIMRWISNEELELYGSTGFSIDTFYFYNVVSNNLRTSHSEEENE